VPDRVCDVPSVLPAHRTVVIRSVLTVTIWIGITGLVVAAGALVTHWGVLDRFDHHVTNWVVAHRSHALDATMKAITWCGSWVAVAVTGGLLIALVAARKLPLVVVILAAAGWVGEVATVNLVKVLVDRQRPPQALWLVTAHGSSFPSGHAANATLVFAALGFSWCILTHSWSARLAGGALSLLGAAAVGFSRVELGVHWTTDVIVGFVAVSAWLIGIGSLFADRLPLLPAFPVGQGTVSGRTTQTAVAWPHLIVTV